METLKDITDFDKAIKCLALELPEPVWRDVNDRWQKAKAALSSIQGDGYWKQRCEAAERVIDDSSPGYTDAFGQQIYLSRLRKWQQLKSQSPESSGDGVKGLLSSLAAFNKLDKQIVKIISDELRVDAEGICKENGITYFLKSQSTVVEGEKGK